jgi:hypothetical protein
VVVDAKGRADSRAVRDSQLEVLNELLEAMLMFGLHADDHDMQNHARR